MIRLAKPLAIFTASLLIPVLGCQGKEHQSAEGASASSGSTHMQAESKTATATIKPGKGAATQPSNKNVGGTVTFTQVGDGVHVVGDLTGLAPGKHGIHIHEKTDFSDPALMSVGGHWNPGMHKHGGPETTERHAGDLGNVEADKDGKAHLDETIQGISVGGTNSVVGHSVVVHAKEDDLKTDPSGNSGGRVAAGAIEMGGPK